MTSYEMDTITTAIDRIESAHKAERAAWDAYIDGDDTETFAALRKAWTDACHDVAVEVDMWLPSIKRVIAGAKVTA